VVCDSSKNVKYHCSLEVIGVTESGETGTLESAEEFFGKYNQEHIFCPAESAEDFRAKVNAAR
jgi:hypothetical protein